MEPADRTPERSGLVPVLGELIFENGKPAGARRALKAPVTVIGRAAGCDIRLKGGDVEPLHCLLLAGPDGLVVRDLQTATGTIVNGSRVADARVHDGDSLKVGGYLFRLSLAMVRAQSTTVDSPHNDALRVQAAAVAAQQAALAQEELRLKQRLEALEKQEEQLAAHLEEKRRNLIQLGERAREERAALARERAAHEQHVKQIGGDLSDAQRDLLEQQQQVQVERRRLGVLQGRLHKRWQQRFAADQKRLAWRAEELANDDANLKKESETIAQEREALAAERLTFTSDYELGRRRVRDAWTRLRQERQDWRRRRSQERAALRLRARELDEQQHSLAAAEAFLHKEAETAQTRCGSLEKELDGLSQRVRNQRDKILEQQLELNRLEAVLRERRTQANVPATAAPEEHAVASAPCVPEHTPSLPSVADASAAPAADNQDGKARRIPDLDRLATELAEQRLQLASQWQGLVHTKDQWEQDRATAAAELEALIHAVQDQEQAVDQRERACRVAEESLRTQHRELVQMQQNLVGWRARLRTCEITWEGEREQVLSEVQHRERLVEQHLKALADIRRRWANQRGQELEKLRRDRAAAEILRRECLQLRQECQRRHAALEEGKRILLEKTLAVEHFQQEACGRSGDAPATQRRVERLRRRWLTHNAAALRAFSQERQALKSDFAALEARQAELHQRAEEILEAEVGQTENRADRDQRQAESTLQLERVQQDLSIALTRRKGAEQQLQNLKDELEKVALSLLEEPELPILAMDKAA